jgi:hypothetical protein
MEARERVALINLAEQISIALKVHLHLSAQIVPKHGGIALCVPTRRDYQISADSTYAAARNHFRPNSHLHGA